MLFYNWPNWIQDLHLTYFNCCSDSLWMALPLESSRTQSQLGFHFQRTRQWGYTLVSGMLMTGQQEVDLSRQTGARHPLLLPTETSKLMLAYGLLEHLLVVHLPPIVVPGFHNSWTLQIKTGWNGCRRTTWYIITAETLRGFPRASLQNAAPREKEIPSIYIYRFFYYINYSIHVISTIQFFHAITKMAKPVLIFAL